MQRFRRQLLVPALVVALFLGALTGCGSDPEETETGPVLTTATVTRLADTSDGLAQPELTETFRLPAGSIVEVDAPTYAAVRSITGLPHPLNRFSLLDLRTGRMTTLLGQAVRHDAGFDIVDARAGERVAAWVETNMTTGEWSVQAGRLDGISIGTPVEVASGDATTMLPSIGVSGDEVIWLVSPDEGAEGSTGNAVLSALTLGSGGEPRVLFESAETVSLPVTVAGRVATVAERRRVTGIRQSTIRAIDIDSADEIASLELPAPINPSDAVYLDGRFSFSVPARYDGVGPLGDVGTFLQVEDAEFIRVARQPLDTPALVDGRFVVKDGRAISIVEADSKTHATLPTVDKLPDYGEYLASNGIASDIVTFTSPDVAMGEEPFTTVQVYSY